jgi:hypothetical protein
VSASRQAEYVRRVIAMAECLEDAAKEMRATLEANPDDVYGLKMRLADAQSTLPLIADLTSRLIELRVCMKGGGGG